MKRKTIKLITTTLLLSFLLSFSSLAGQWVYDGPESWKWWYQEDDGSYPLNSWREIEGKWYHFDEIGYMDNGWQIITTTKVENRQDGSQYMYDIDLWYSFDISGALITEGNWDGGAIGPDGSLCIDNTRYEDGELFYQRSWTKGLPDAIGEPKDYNGYRGFYSCAIPWKQELANYIDSEMGSEIGTFKIDYQLPETWRAECPRPLMSEMIRKVALSKVEYINESLERNWEVDSNNIIHITIKRSLSN